MQLSVSVELQKLNQAIAAKSKLSGKSMAQIVQYDAGYLAGKLNKALRAISPAKGSIKSAQLARFHAGEGIRVSPWVKQRVMEKYNVRTSIGSRRQIGIVKSLKRETRLIFGAGLWEKMVEMEINSRESGRGFLGVSSLYSGGLLQTSKAKSRVGQTLSTFVLKAHKDGATGTFTWDGSLSTQAAGAAQGLTDEPKAQTAIATALAATTAYIQTYIDRKMSEDIAKSGLK